MYLCVQQTALCIYYMYLQTSLYLLWATLNVHPRYKRVENIIRENIIRAMRNIPSDSVVRNTCIYSGRSHNKPNHYIVVFRARICFLYCPMRSHHVPSKPKHNTRSNHRSMGITYVYMCSLSLCKSSPTEQSRLPAVKKRGTLALLVSFVTFCQLPSSMLLSLYSSRRLPTRFVDLERMYHCGPLTNRYMYTHEEELKRIVKEKKGQWLNST